MNKKIDFTAWSNRMKAAALIHPGLVLLGITEAKLTKAKSGADMIQIKGIIISPDGTKDETVWDNFPLLETMQWKLVQFCEALGIDSLPANLDDFVGKITCVEIGPEKYEGRTSNKVQKWLPAEQELEQEYRPEE